MRETVLYQVQAIPEKRLIDVKCTIPNPDPLGQRVLLPAWIPGSYLIRNFSGHIVTLQAYDHEQVVPVQMLDKNTWFCGPTCGPLVVHYQVHAYDLTPRGAHVDSTHAFFNGSRVFLQVCGQEEAAVHIEIIAPFDPKYHHWRVATSLERVGAESFSFGLYQARHYEDLIDHPVEMGEFEVFSFEVVEVVHDLVVIGKHRADINRLKTDLSCLCEYHIRFFGVPAPMKKYTFLLTVLNDGYGGLEHCSSSVIHCKRAHLPKFNDIKVSDGYRTLLGLLSHEYFHAWNVKCIKPSAFSPYHLTCENYTRQLWIFEGITSYYDELALVRTKRISKENYLELLGQLCTRVYSTPGRFKQTLEQASFEAWIKFYRPDENSLNATISYYTKGALVALALDLLLRHETNNQCSLDQVMQVVWQRFGMTRQGLPEEYFERIVEEVSGCRLKDFFDRTLRSTEDFLIAPYLEKVGIVLNIFSASSMEEVGGRKPMDLLERPLLEVKLKPGTSDVHLACVFEGSAAEMAGLAPGDIIIAVNGFRVDRVHFESVIAHYAVGEEVLLHVFRRDILMTFKVVLRSGWLHTYVLATASSLTEQQRVLLQSWLNCDIS